jgi:hypothetical protein
MWCFLPLLVAVAHNLGGAALLLTWYTIIGCAARYGWHPGSRRARWFTVLPSK